MDYEKKYNEALKRAKAAIDIAADKDLVKGVATTIFPELRGSEDERIRKEMIAYFAHRADVTEFIDEGEDCKRWISYLEKQKEQKPIKMEVYEVGKGTTICGQDYKCKKDYKEGNCWYIKDVVYHCSRDGYLTDQNGISWSCTPEWFKEYIQSNTEWAEEEKTHFVSGQFLQCKLSFDGFKEGEHYWLEYVGNDMYVGRSDNILNQKFHITPRQLFTLFSQELEEVQGPPQEEKQVSLNYEPPFDENPSDKEIVEALIKHLKEQDGFLTAIDSVSTKAILSWLEKQKEQKPIDYPYLPGWRKNRDNNKPELKRSVLMLTTHGVAEGEWLGEKWCQYRWSCELKDGEVLYWIHLSDLERLEKEGEEKQKEPTKEELYAEAGTTENEYIANTMKMVRAMREKQKEQKPSWKPSDQDELMKLKYAGTSTKLD